MRNLDRNPRRNQRGFTVAEVIVATAVFALIFIAALALYDRSNEVFKKGMESADMQQNTRVAFDKLVQDVRMAGFDYDRDGNPSGAGGGIWQPTTAYTFGDVVIPPTPNGFSYEVATPGTSDAAEPAAWNTALSGITIDGGVRWRTTSAINQYQQPDEQIEHAGPTSLVVRGNFDFEVENGPTQENGREPAYQSAQFPVVTTGNDEIVGYGLVSRDDTKNVQSIKFFVDVNTGLPPTRRAYPGGDPETEKSINRVDLTNNNPPYTLFRFTLADDGSVVRSPLAENIRSLNFTYFQDSAGQQFLTDLNVPPRDVRRGDSRSGGTEVLGLGQFDPNNPLAPADQRGIRKRIQSVLVQLQGMNPERDSSFTDAAETIASVRNYRKFNLQSLVTPRNIGKRGMREQDTREPGDPIILSVCVGHCGIVRVTWQAPAVNASQGAVEQFAVLYDTIPPTLAPPPVQMGITTEGFVYGLTPNTPYRFRVQAINSWGARTSTNFLDATPLNRTKPNPPSNLLASRSNRDILLSWTRPLVNAAGSLSCLPAEVLPAPPAVPANELSAWRVWRSTNPTFDPYAPLGTDNLVVLWDETMPAASPNAPLMNSSTGEVQFVDRRAACGVQYYYRVAALDSCRRAPALNDGDVTVIGGISDPFPVGNPAYAGSFTIASPDPPPDPPKAPINLDSLDTSGCVGGVCTVNLKWNKVTEDTTLPTANLITVDRYRISRVQKKMITGIETPIGLPTIIVVNGISSTDPADPFVLYTDSGVQEFDTDMLPFIYDYTVAAEYCSVPSLPSNTERFPCVFAGGTPIITIRGSVVDGDGVNTPWLLDGTATVTAVYAMGVTSLTSTLTLNGVTIGTPIVLTPPASPTDIPIPDLNDGQVYVLTITMRDGNRCTHTEVRTLAGSPTGCCLNPFNVDPTVMTASGNTISLRLRNLCDDTLTINSITYIFNRGGNSGAFRLTDIRWPGALDVTPNQSASPPTYTMVPPLGATRTIPRGTTYTILLIFNRNVTPANLNEFTGNYTRPLPESCRIVPPP